MPFFSRGDDDQVDDYDEYDPTPYGGGYDITLTYGRPFPSSDETCYPINSASGEIDCDRPNYSSYSEPSAYADEARETEYNSYARPKPPPGSTYGGPQPAYGFQPGMNRPGSEYGSYGYVKPASEEYGRIPETEYGPDGNGKPQGEEYGSGYGRRPESEYESGDHERPSEYGSGYGRRQESEYGSMYERPQSEEYGSGYGRRPDSEYGPGGNGKPQVEEYGSGYGRRPENEASEYGSGYEKPSEYGRTAEYGSGYGRRPGSENEGDGSEYGSGYGRKESCGEEGEGYGGRSRYEKPIYRDDSPKRSSHGRQEGGGEFGRPSHGSRRSDDDDEDRRRKYRDGSEEGHGRKKYVGFFSNSLICASDLKQGLTKIRRNNEQLYVPVSSTYGDDNSDDDTEKKHRHHRNNYDD
ncbi:hypothetical protein DKX38_006166 [Salix brachista]|uniref:Uncharacterized protein n=1 Tax=Salix brachista TaxID=2182728 RepID=A0A5N5N1K5_9ROSI|nr:hypothetical protein DKX38_006166 [Salix brachista]